MPMIKVLTLLQAGYHLKSISVCYEAICISVLVDS